jgi:hypothetical protein
VLFGVILGLCVLMLFGWALRTKSVAARWPGSQTPAVVHTQLEGAAVHDHASVEKHFVGKWVPQLLLASETRPDLTTTTANAHDLLDYLPLRRRYGALLVRSGDYNFGTRGRYASIVPRAYQSPKQALAWCRKAHLGPDRCIAKHLTHAPVVPAVITR